MKRILTFTLIAALACLAANAQTARTAATSTTKKTKANVTGFIKDSETGEALVRAAVQIMTEDTTQMITGGVANTMGGYTIKAVEEGTYIAKITYLGYHNFYRKITIKHGETIHNVGTTLMIPNTVLLETAVVTGSMPQMEVKEDTIIFNADAFKVPEGSVLEDLVKKLPGAEVGSDGSITINGKSVSKILVNGKEFFSNDKDMAMKNIPTEIVDKIKTYDKASDQERLTGIADGNEETVIDLTLKKGMNKGMFGNVDLGYGTEDQYANRFTLQRFVDDTFQASLIGNANSTGGGGMGMGRGGGGNGKTHSSQIGVNVVASQRDKYEIGGNIRYNARKSESESRSASENYVMATNTTFSDRLNNSRNHNDNANADLKIEIKLDTATTLLIRPTFGFGNSASRSEGLSATYNSDPYQFNEITNPLLQWDALSALMDSAFVNHTHSASRSFSDSKNASANWTLNRRFYNKQGRNFSLNGNFSYNKSEGDNFNLSDVTYYQRETTPADLIYRYRFSPNTSKSFNVGFSYSEPIATNLILQTSYSYSYSYRKNNSDTYNLGMDADIQALKDSLVNILGYLPDSYFDYLDKDLSNYNTNVDGNHNINVQIRWNSNFITSSIGVQMQPQHQHLQMKYMGVDVDTTRNFFRISPTIQFRYRFNRQNQINFSYRGNMNQPSITDMIDMTDDSNPLNIRKGNPALKNSFSNNFSLGWNNYITATMQSINLNASFSNTMNSISSRTEYDELTGRSTTMPMNINGQWNVSGSLGFNTPLFANERLMLNTSTSTGYNNNVSYLYRNDATHDHETLKNQTNNLRLGENISITYRANNWDVRANGRFSYNHQSNKYVTVNSPNTFDFSYGAETNGNFDNGWGFATNISMSSRRGYASREANTNEVIWNAQVSYRFLKGRAATLSLQAYDILNQRSNFSRNINANGRTDTWTQTVNSYVMAHFIYRFRIFGTASQRRSIREERAEREAYRANAEAENNSNTRANAEVRGGNGARPNGGNGGNRGGNMGGGGRF